MSAAAERARVEADVRLAIERLYASVLIARAREHAAEVAMHRDAASECGRAAGGRVGHRRVGARARRDRVGARRRVGVDDRGGFGVRCRERAAKRARAPAGHAARARRAGIDGAKRCRRSTCYVAKALAASPDVAAARAAVEQAHHAAALARADYIPDVGVGVTYTMLDGVSFLPRHAVGLEHSGIVDGVGLGKARLAVARARRAGGCSGDWPRARSRPSVGRGGACVSRRRARRAWRGGRSCGARCASCGADDHPRSLRHGRVDRDVALSAAEAELAESEARALAAELQIRIARAELTRAIGG